MPAGREPPRPVTSLRGMPQSADQQVQGRESVVTITLAVLTGARRR